MVQDLIKDQPLAAMKAVVVKDEDSSDDDDVVVETSVKTRQAFTKNQVGFFMQIFVSIFRNAECGTKRLAVRQTTESAVGIGYG